MRRHEVSKAKIGRREEKDRRRMSTGKKKRVRRKCLEDGGMQTKENRTREGLQKSRGVQLEKRG